MSMSESRISYGNLHWECVELSLVDRRVNRCHLWEYFPECEEIEVFHALT